METKIANPLNFFKLFGLRFDGSKLSKWIQILWVTISVIKIAHTIYFGSVTDIFSELEYVIRYSLSIHAQMSALGLLLLTYKYCVREQEMLNNLEDVHELVEKYLRIKIDYTRFNREVFWKIAIQILILCGTIIFRYTNRNEIYSYNDFELPMPDIAVLCLRLHYMKYNFYIDLMHFQMKVKNV